MIQLNIWAFVAAILVSLLVGFALGRVGTGASSQSKLPAEGPMALDLSHTSTAEVRELLQADRKIEAIKRLRAETGMGLREAKDAVDRMALEMSLPGNFDGTRMPLADDAQQQLPSGAEGSGATSVSAANMAEIRQLILKQNKIAAIKLYREATGVGLKEAKQVVERMAENMRG